MSEERVAIVGVGLTYPDAGTTAEFWENVLAGRRAFRKLPDERMNTSDYFSADPQVPDRFYADHAAVLRDFSFDRAAYRIAGSTYRSTDTTHWLALDTAAKALTDAGFPDGEGLPHITTGVVLGNSLTGEFSRANVMRLRWPYVRRTVAAALADQGWAEDAIAGFLKDLQARYKAPFPPIDEDTLAGGLANTIAGRICNHYDLRGGGYTVDGACSSSLLSVVTAANALVERDLDVVLAGGVDLSIDPFELIGFAKTGALATGQMKVYDEHSNGFWPGEGAGVLVLMRESDALAENRRIYASITGWGVSSDGKGGMTRPDAEGHRLALKRAYARAGYGVETVAYFEGHGTGTAVGDAVEIAALSGARRAAGPGARRAALGTVKGNIGHTKAAAGVAGLIKAALAVHHQVIPPVTGNTEPHHLLTADDATIYLPRTAELFPTDADPRVGVSAMGFGGINSHIAISSPPGTARRAAIDATTRALVAGRQDCELLVLDAEDVAGLRGRVEEAAAAVGRLALAELADVAATLAATRSGGPVRAAVVASSPAQAATRLTALLAALDEGATSLLGTPDGVFLETSGARRSIGLLFPGQGVGQAAAGALRARFAEADEVYRSPELPAPPVDGADASVTEVAQPRIVAGSLAALRVLTALGVEADAAVGHSLGELTALHWAGALDEGQLLALATTRGRVMAATGAAGGAMAGIAAHSARIGQLLDTCGDEVVVSGFNGPQQTVISGPAEQVDRVCEAARAQGLAATRLAVSHAFHSPLVEDAAAALAPTLAAISFARPRRSVVSTVTGEFLHAGEDLAELLREQVVAPVRFREAAERLVQRCDLLVEVGPGRVLSGLVQGIAPDAPVLVVDSESRTLEPLLRVVAAAFTGGSPVALDRLFAGRAVRDLPLDRPMTFLASPCEAAPGIDASMAAQDDVRPEVVVTPTAAGSTTTFDLLRSVVASRVELPLDEIGPDTHPLDDLHLSSITVGQIVNDVTRALERPALEGMPNFATVCLGELAELIDELAESARPDDRDQRGEVAGVAPWVRPFAVEEVRAPAPIAQPGGAAAAEWTVHAPDGHPLAEPLRAALASAGIGDGVLLCLPPDIDAGHVGLMLAASREALAAATGTRFVVVEQGMGAAALARTLHLEDPSTRTTVVELADVIPTNDGELRDAVTRVVAEAASTTEYSEARYDAEGVRWVPAMRSLGTAPDPADERPPPLGADDVMVVTGGGKGITAESALAVARESGAALILLGRSAPEDDPELAANLERMRAAGVRYRYERVDVTDAARVRAAVAAGGEAFGPVTAILHGAGRNEPAALFSLTEEAFRATLAPKIDGLRAVLDAVDPRRIKVLVTFGSIIGRAGLRGEAHYATANDWMSALTARFAREHPGCRTLALEWSVWSGAGMGEKLGVVSALQRDGITPISTEEGIATLRRLLADPAAPVISVICGRTAGLATLPVEREEAPLTRFVDRVVVHYPGVEMITEADLSVGSDPYLLDHLLDGDLLFPAVMGMEAMTQVAAAAGRLAGVPRLEDVEFLRPIAVPRNAGTIVRIAALVRDARTVDVVIRSSETSFSADHFRARLRFGAQVPATTVAGDTVVELPPVPCDPITELYGRVLFQGKRFQRLIGYRRAAARHAVAEVAATRQDGWFAPYLPQEQILADPGTRDVVMHAIQCCVPDAILLPQGIERLHLTDPAAQDVDYVVLDAVERLQDGDSYVYDVDVRDPAGTLVERWEGLRLRAVRSRGGAGPWAPAMLGSYLERALEGVLGGDRRVVVEPDAADHPARTITQRREQTRLALSRAAGRSLPLRHRPDGKPETDGMHVSASHSVGLTLVVAGTGTAATCDIETALERTSEDWVGLLGPDLLELRDLLARECAEPVWVAATRVWSALECVRKTGASTQALALHTVRPDGWALLSAGSARIATWVTTVNDRPDPTVVAVLETGEG